MAKIKFAFEKGRRFGNIAGTFITHARGVTIDVKHDQPPARPEPFHLGPDTPTDHNVICVKDDQYRWCQTIDTNEPLGGTTSPYVDPRPSDDPGTPKPFYWTDAEHTAHSKRFFDRPSRNAVAGKTVTWRATLSLCAVNEKKVTRIKTIHYGFDIEPTGTVKQAAPTDATNAQVKTHMATLKSEFASWTFE